MASGEHVDLSTIVRACDYNWSLRRFLWGSELEIQLFRERLSYKRGIGYATMSKVIMGNGGFYSCLSEP